MIDRQRDGGVHAAHQQEACFAGSGLDVMEILICLQKSSESTDTLHQLTQSRQV
ncbi:hypothetical protein GTP45_02230 [Pseudoduganella sp. FT55W]|uniref:Uncharacterized protein n=1 Tax=Duganella rivi TaxID=2666083 RepID=A0A7X4K9X9_9BURK|nr:hypothetical protein [Duganella rivi]MYM65649.1 hypothetical protein [Duganella rivi]